MARGGSIRPFGVTVIAFLTLIMVVVSLVIVATRARPAETTDPERLAAMRRSTQLAGLWAGPGLVTAAGLFGMRRWGWWLTIIYYAGAIVLLAVRQPGPDMMTFVFQGGLSVLVILYLMSPDVRRSFGKR